MVTYSICKHIAYVKTLKDTRLLKIWMTYRNNETNHFQPISLVSAVIEISKSGKIPAGQTEIPFELPLKPKGTKTLYETYHGVYVTVQYSLRCDIKRSLLAKDVTKAQEFIVEYKVIFIKTGSYICNHTFPVYLISTSLTPAEQQTCTHT